MFAQISAVAYKLYLYEYTQTMCISYIQCYNWQKHGLTAILAGHIFCDSNRTARSK